MGRGLPSDLGVVLKCLLKGEPHPGTAHDDPALVIESSLVPIQDPADGNGVGIGDRYRIDRPGSTVNAAK
jgi:hypothetical protein